MALDFFDLHQSGESGVDNGIEGNTSEIVKLDTFILTVFFAKCSSCSKTQSKHLPYQRCCTNSWHGSFGTKVV